MAFLMATTSLPAVYRPNGYARMTTTGTPHARANSMSTVHILLVGEHPRDDRGPAMAVVAYY